MQRNQATRVNTLTLFQKCYGTPISCPIQKTHCTGQCTCHFPGALGCHRLEGRVTPTGQSTPLPAATGLPSQGEPVPTLLSCRGKPEVECSALLLLTDNYFLYLGKYITTTHPQFWKKSDDRVNKFSVARKKLTQIHSLRPVQMICNETGCHLQKNPQHLIINILKLSCSHQSKEQTHGRTA